MGNSFAPGMRSQSWHVFVWRMNAYKTFIFLMVKYLPFALTVDSSFVNVAVYIQFQLVTPTPAIRSLVERERLLGTRSKLQQFPELCCPLSGSFVSQSTCPGEGLGCRMLSRAVQASLSLATGSSYAWGVPRRSQARRSQEFPGVPRPAERHCTTGVSWASPV